MSGSPRDIATDAEFWLLVDRGAPEACWEWRGYRNRDGYGFTNYRDKPERAHRIAWTTAHGPIPSGLCVMHRCDNRPCCNPGHLALGTNAQNVADMVSKGRQRSVTGAANYLAKLTDAQVLRLRAIPLVGGTVRGLAREWGVSQGAAQHAAIGITWRHLPLDAAEAMVRLGRVQPVDLFDVDRGAKQTGLL